jgi:hypothetical protein
MEWNWQKQKFIPPMTQVDKINLLKPGLAAGLIVLALLHATNGFDARADEPAGRPDGRAAQPPRSSKNYRPACWGRGFGVVEFELLAIPLERGVLETRRDAAQQDRLGERAGV